MIIEIIIASLGVLGSMGVLYCQKKEERKAKDRETKEKMYIGFLEALIHFKTLNADGVNPSKALQSVYLVGNEEVVVCTRKLIKYLETEENKTKQMQDELYTAMVIAMKRDLYGTKGSASLPVELGLTTFTIN